MSAVPIKSQIEAVSAAILAIEDAIEMEETRIARGKAPTGLRPVREMRLQHWRAIKQTLEAVETGEARG